MDNDERFRVSKALARNMATEYLSSEICQIMGMDGPRIAAAIRDKSESNIDQQDRRVQEYRRIEDVFYWSVWQLLGGRDGYVLKKL